MSLVIDVFIILFCVNFHFPAAVLENEPVLIPNLSPPPPFLGRTGAYVKDEGLITGAPNENIFQNHLNIALLNVF